MNSQKRLVRSRTDRMIGGVCGGFGNYFNIDPTLIRIAFAMLIFIGIGSPLLLYLLLWIIMPNEGSAHYLAEDGADYSSAEATDPTIEIAPVVQPPAVPVERNTSNPAGADAAGVATDSGRCPLATPN